MTQSPTPPPPPPPGPPPGPPPAYPPGPVGPPPELPGATAGLVLGICSIVFTVPLIGLLLGFLGFIKSKEAKQFLELNPGLYGNAGVAQAGYVCSIIGLVLGGFSSLCGCGYAVVVVIALMGAAASHGGGM